MKYRLRASTVVVHNNKILTFYAEDPYDGRVFYFLPGGSIESNETAPAAAERETLEETGYKVQVNIDSAIDKDYVFHWNGEDVQCTTIFYRAQILNPFQSVDPVIDAPYNKGVVWVSVENIDETFSYSEEIKEAVNTLVRLY